MPRSAIARVCSSYMLSTVAACLQFRNYKIIFHSDCILERYEWSSFSPSSSAFSVIAIISFFILALPIGV